MARTCLSVLLVFCTIFLLEASCRPSSNNELTTSINEDVTETNNRRTFNDDEKHTLPDDYTKEILDKINIVNAGLQKPKRRQQIKYNTESPNSGAHVLNRDILEKLQQIIASGKLQSLLESENYQESNSLNDFHTNPQRYSRNLPYTPNTMMGNQISASIVPLPYVANIPVLVTPYVNTITPGLGYDYNQADGISQYQTRQRPPPSFTFQLQWPLAQYFPILIKDPLLTVLQGGGWNNLFETGQSADVCSRKQKFTVESDNETYLKDFVMDSNTQNSLKSISREGRGLKKRNISKSTAIEDNIANAKKSEKFFAKPTTQKPTKQSVSSEPPKNTKLNNEDDDALRFGAFTFFGDRKPVAPSPGFFINKLKVRRGGVAIAGPGGVATAGRGGTAIVGPGGLAYTQPGGLAVAGPAARVVALSPESNLSSIISQLQQLSAKDGSVPRDYEQYQNRGFSWRSDIYQHNAGRFVKDELKPKISKFSIFVRPRAFALSGSGGVAIANPVSNVVIAQNDIGSVVHAPSAAAVAGPGGIAHAQSDLYLYEGSVQYLPFYGGGKGMYLEIKKDTSGRVISELVVSEDKISMDSVMKHNDENLLAKVLAANLQNLKALSSSALKLHNLGRRTGSLDNADKERFKNQLEKLGETASNTIKLIEEVTDNIDGLFKSNPKLRQYDGDEEDEISDEGVGIEAPADDDPNPGDILGGATIAEAKPIGLAVIGENGLAASRPIGTAVAISGVAIARPVATAIAGVNPSALGLNLSINHSKN
ncbi:uncharacterized protein LOC128670840 [Plodia interpunctella]|uniref:uncharacterized protein LOC128670840 n=1 Tax=Plodia interpunctella TaxID=58824 RepID=UPI0023677455|nr:uncharacterized protein LOC128670840 [Plodia interpunctella]